MREGWTYKRLGDVCTIERGGSPRPIDAFITTEDNGLNWIKIGDAVEGSKYISSTKEKIKPEGLKKTRFVHKGDFILSKSMSFGKPYILNIDGCIHDGWLVIHEENDTFDKSFLYYLLGSPNMYREFKRLAVGGVVNNLNSKVVRDVIVPVPPLQEQERIVVELDLLTGIIDKQKQQLKELDNLAQSIFYDMFGNPVENDRGWDVRTLEDLADVGSSRRIFAEEYTDIGIPFYRIKEVVEKSRKQALSVELFISKERYSEIKSKNGIPSVGDILITAVGTIGEIWVVDSEEPFYFKDGNIIWLHSISNDVNSTFFRYQLETLIEDYKKKVSIGSAYSALTIVKLKQLLCPIPPRDIQDLFSEKIASIESQKKSINRSLAESQKLFDYTMDKYFG